MCSFLTRVACSANPIFMYHVYISKLCVHDWRGSFIHALSYSAYLDQSSKFRAREVMTLKLSRYQP